MNDSQPTAGFSRDVDDFPPRELYLLLTALVVPRPIGWVSTVSANGVPNLAPHSFYNLVSGAPPILHFTSSPGAQGAKDSLQNVRDTGEFVLNVVSAELAEAMNATSADCPPEVDEFRLAGLEAAPSVRVRPPRVAAAKATLECRFRQELTFGEGTMVFGDVVHVHVDGSVLSNGRIDQERLRPVARLAGSQYSLIEKVFTMKRPHWDDRAGS